jgi:autoinducer 2 (AI-2) kinase
VTRLLTIDAWLASRLCGSDGRASVSNASTTGLLDLPTRTWSALDEAPWREPGDARFGAWLPPLAEGGATVGAVTASMSRHLGVPAGIPVAAGGGDAQVAAAGVGCLADGERAVVMGSHWQSVVTLERPLIDAEARYRVIAHAVPDRWQADAIAWGAGLFLDWFVRAFGATGGSAAGAAHASLGDEAASLPPGAGGILAVAGLPMTTSAWSQAAPSLLGFSLGEAGHARAAAYRAIVEAGCLAVATNLEVIADGTMAVTDEATAIVVAGGTSRSGLACQVLADVTGRTVARSATPQASTVGAAACAAIAAGWYRDVETAAKAMARIDRRFEPDPGAHEAYRELAPRWQAAAEAQRGLAGDGITMPVWKPAS